MTLDDEALDRLYKRYANSLLRYFQRRVADPELATDLMADTFATVLEQRQRYRGTSEQELSGWVWRIGQSTLREHEERGRTRARGASRVGRERRQLTDSEIERIEDDAMSERLREAVRRCLDRLPAEQREAVRLRVVEGLTYAEVSERLGIGVATTRVQVMRGVQKLRGMLEPIFSREEGAPW